jgi:dihydroorotase
MDGPGVIVVEGQRIIAVQPEAQSQAGLPAVSGADGYAAPQDCIVLPGLIDLHAHPANSHSIFGTDPDTTMLPCGVTTVQSQGDSGADGIAEFLATTVNASQTQVLLALNLSRIGESSQAGSFADLRNADVDRCVSVARQFPDLIRMVAVNASHHACGDTDPRDVLRRGRLVAEQSGLPLLFGMRRPEDWPLENQLQLLRTGDVVTYCFRKSPHCIVDNGRVLPCIVDARQRGIQFDVGHGMGSFSFEVAEAAIHAGFIPDTISTDLQNRHAGQSPRHDLPYVMSKLAAAGMSDSDIFRAVTATPASILKLDRQIGSLSIGSTADIVVLEEQSGVTMSDVHGCCRTGTRFFPRCIIRNGRMTSVEQGWL